MASSSTSPAEQETSSARPEVLSTRWLPRLPPKTMERIEGWGYDRIPDLSGKVFIVTGGTSGIGQVTAKELAQRGAHVIAASPTRERGEDAVSTMESSGMRGTLEWAQLDLASLDNVRAFATDFRNRGLPLHGLVCNAALQLRVEDRSANGMEQRWGVNYVGHFLLIHELLERLMKSTPSRLVLVSSVIESMAPGIPWDDPLGLEPPAGADWYGHSKLAMLMTALELSRRLEGTGVDVFAAHPGISQTDLFRKMTRRTFAAGALDWLQSLQGQSAERGALPLAYAAAEPSLQGRSGQYFGSTYVNLGLIQWTPHLFPFMSLTPRHKEARDPHARYRLYDQTAEALEQFMRRPLPHRLKGVHIKRGGKGHVGASAAAGATRAHEE